MGLDAQHGILVSKPSLDAGTGRSPFCIAIIGAGPAGLFAAERLCDLGCDVTLYERMPTPARKFLLAGRGGLNLTHSEELTAFLTRYSGSTAPLVRHAISKFPPASLVAWANGLGVETFTGSSGRVFPTAMKASPLLRAWLRRLKARGLILKTGWKWRGFDGAPTALLFDTQDGPRTVTADAVLLGLGGASWSRLGSDGGWAGILRDAGVQIAAFSPSNCGVTVPWSAHMAKHAGAPLKRIAITCGGETRTGEAVITSGGLEGGALYALSPHMRDALRSGPADLIVDLRADLPAHILENELSHARPKSTWTDLLRRAGLTAAKAAIVREAGPVPRDPHKLTRRIKQARIAVTGLSGIERAISTAGGIEAGALTGAFMLRALPGAFAAGEMLDVDAPTGGYLLQAAFATGHAAAEGMAAWLASREPHGP